MGGKSAPAPDYSGMESVAREQLAFSKQQYADMMPIAQEIAGLQSEAQRQQMDQAADYYAYQQDTFRPLEQGLVQRAQEMDTDAYRQEMAAEASAASARAFSTSNAMNQRSMAARGVNPNSGAARGASAATGLQQAAMRAQSMTGARQGARDRADAAQYQAAGLGRGLATNSLQAFQGASGAGSAALGSYQSPGAQYQSGLSGAGSMYGQMAGTQASVYSNAMNSRAQMLGTALGAGVGIAALSDRRLKKNISRVGVDGNTGLNLYQFNYIDELDDDGTYIGVMADEVRAKYPEAVITMSNGFDAVNYEDLGIEMTKVGEE
jgi:hypothetical protein